MSRWDHDPTTKVSDDAIEQESSLERTLVEHDSPKHTSPGQKQTARLHPVSLTEETNADESLVSAIHSKADSSTKEKIPVLVAIEGPLVGKHFEINAVVSIGTNPQNSIYLPFCGETYLATLTYTGDVLVVEDANNHRTLFMKGHTLRFGPHAFRFETLDSVLGAFHREVQTRIERDDLTGLYSKARFDLEADKALYTLKPHEQLLLMMFDVDNLKHTNDNFGHKTGENILKHLAHQVEMWMSHLKEKGLIEPHTGFAARSGGDEFFLALTFNKHLPVENIGKLLVDWIVSVPWVHADQTQLPIHISWGAAWVPKDASQLHETWKKADRMLYEMKQSETKQLRASRLHGT